MCNFRHILVLFRVRPKGFFLFRPKPKLTEIAIFLFGRNRYRNRKYFSVSAETEPKPKHSLYVRTMVAIFLYFDFLRKTKNKKKQKKFSALIFLLITPQIPNFKKITKLSEKKCKNYFPRSQSHMFRLATETEFLFRPIPKPKPKGVLQFRQNRNSAKMAEIRPKTETESVSVVP